MRRSLASPLIAVIGAAVLCGIVATRAPAQIPAPWPSSFPMPTASPTEALTGTITASEPFQAQLQTSNGSLRLQLHPGTVIHNPNLLGYGGPFLLPRFEGVVVGQRVYVHGFPQSDGSLRADEIDVVRPLLTTSIIPTAPSSPAPAAT